MGKLEGVRVAILVANGFEQHEMTDPKKALDDEGAETVIVSPEKNKVRGWKHNKWGSSFLVDENLSKANAGKFDALLLPGGVLNPDHLRMDIQAVNFVKKFVKAGKPIAAICHGPWTLINAQAVKGKTLTSWASIKMDLINAGAKWVDKEVVRDGKLITSRKPDDIPAFNKEIIKLFSQLSKNK